MGRYSNWMGLPAGIAAADSHSPIAATIATVAWKRVIVTSEYNERIVASPRAASE